MSNTAFCELSEAERLRQLAALRAELDRVDDGLHDQLMRRAALVAQVGALGVKGRVPLRPGREAAILRRLVGRNAGSLAAATLVRVWREMLAGSSAQQQPMRVVVGDAVLRAAACEHFGALTEAEVVTPGAALAQLRDGTATLAVLPMPADGVDWWTGLLAGPRLFVVARLPFWARAGVPEALLISSAAPDGSGNDRTLVAGAGLTVGRRLAMAGDVVLAEVDGLVAADDPLLAGLAVTVLGAYAVQMGDER